MKRSILLFSICLSLFIIQSNAQQNSFRILNALGSAWPNKTSQQGEFVVGQKNAEAGFIYDFETEQITYPQDMIEATDVTSDGTVAGCFLYKNFPFGDEVFKDVTVAGILENGVFTSLGIGNLTASEIANSQDGSYANCMSTNKTKVGGYLSKNAFSPVIPCVWSKNEDNTWDFQIYSTPANGFPKPAGKIFSISEDGTMATGWTINQNGSRIATIWKSPTEYILLEGGGDDQGNQISKNGKYIALTCNDKAALYIVDDDRIEIIPTPVGQKNSTATGVTDDGIVVGYTEFGDFISGYRWGFVYSPVFGFYDLADYVETFAPEINTAPIDFRSLNFTVPMCISNDGLTIAGWWGPSAFSQITWILQLGESPFVFNRPLNVTIEVQNHKTVSLAWDAPETMSGFTLTGYDIYKNDQFLMTTEIDVTNYTYDEFMEGTHAYAVVAKYGTDLSPKTDNVYAEIYNMALPFLEDFESGNYATNFWKHDPDIGDNSWWLITLSDWTVPKGISGNCATFASSLPPKSYSLVSKEFNAESHDNVFLKFALEYIMTDPGTSTEKLFIETRTLGDEWKTVTTYDASKLMPGTNTYGWKVETFDISSLAAGKEFQIRFRVHCANSEINNWNIDNVRVDVKPRFDEVFAPSQPECVKMETNNADFIWKSPTGSYDLTYYNGVPLFAMGDEGIPFIAANAFAPEQLTRYIGKFLTSITTHIVQIKSYNPPHELSVVVFADNDFVVDQPVSSFKPNAWNTYPLENPVLIEAGKSYKIGVKVRNHMDDEMVISFDDSFAINKDGNLFSEDNGVTWKRISEENGGDDFFDNLAIIGDITDTDQPTENQRDNDFLGYIMYRNGEPQGKVIYQAKFTDNLASLSDNYALSAYYNNGMESQNSESLILNINETLRNNGIVIYPNPTMGELRIENGELRMENVEIYDVFGRRIVIPNEAQRNEESITIDISHFPNGIYFLIIDAGIQKNVCKVVKY